MNKLIIMLLAAAIAGGCATTKKVDDALNQADKAIDTVAKTVDKAVSIADKAVAKAEDVKSRVEAVPARLESAVTGQMNHTVVKGDTLWHIDQNKGGDGFGWYGIYRSNRDQITDYNLIEPGWNLDWNRREAHQDKNRQRAYDEPPYHNK